MSAQLVLAGIFPPVPANSTDAMDDGLNKTDGAFHRLGWQPIPVHTAKRKEDRLLMADRACEKYGILKKNVAESQVSKEKSIPVPWPGQEFCRLENGYVLAVTGFS